MIACKGVSLSYDGVRNSVEGLSFTISRGELFGFIGPNGAGKTTTIKMITGILQPDEGTIQIDGISMAEEPVKAKRLIGYVPDHCDTFDRLTGWEYLRLLADIYEVPKTIRQERAQYYLTQFEMTDAAHDYIAQYSHGMRQKLLITGALLHTPPVWILDEPLTGLDPHSALVLKDEMRRHCEKGNCVFFSTHVLEVAERLCTRIGVIHKGLLVAVGALENLRAGQKDATLEELFFHLTDRDASREAPGGGVQ